MAAGDVLNAAQRKSTIYPDFLLMPVLEFFNAFISLVKEFLGLHDRFRVWLDAVRPTIEQTTMMHVVSLCEHPIKLKDWGFIERSCYFRSMPLDEQVGERNSGNYEIRGSSHLVERGATFEAGYCRSSEPIGAYGISITQKRPRIYFAPGTPVRLRLRIRFRLLVRPNYFLW